MSIAVRRVGPEDHGRRMSLKDFDRAEGQEGYVYELSKGNGIVTNVPRPSHLTIVSANRTLFYRYDDQHPKEIRNVAGSGESKVLLKEFESERHPDLAVYTTDPGSETAEVWSTWVPDLVVEVVSPDSIERDHDEKPEEYLSFGIREYWIADPFE